MQDRLYFVTPVKKSLPEQCAMPTFIDITFCGEHKHHICAPFVVEL